MLLASAAVVLAAALSPPVPTPPPLPPVSSPSTTPTLPPVSSPSTVVPTPPPVVLIPDTEINVCVIVALGDLDELTRDRAETALERNRKTFPELRNLCGGKTPLPTVPTATSPTRPAPFPDCDDFPTRVAAQEALDGSDDPNNLDVDGDGVACETGETADRESGVVPQFPVGAPATGDGSTTPTSPISALAALLIAMVSGAGGFRAGRQ